MPNLQEIYLDRTQVSDASPIYNLQWLKWIALENTQIKQMPPIENFPFLQHINVAGTPYVNNNIEACISLSNSKAPAVQVVCI
jgi:Leucine-rich repeat (LRR) protein